MKTIHARYDRSYKVKMHFNKPGSIKGKPWTVHFKNVCYLVSRIVCHCPMTSEWKPNKKNNPRAFFITSANSLIIKNNTAYINNI